MEDSRDNKLRIELLGVMEESIWSSVHSVSQVESKRTGRSVKNQEGQRAEK